MACGCVESGGKVMLSEMSSGVAGGGGSKWVKLVVRISEASAVPLAGPPKGSIKGLTIKWAQGHAELLLDFSIVIL